MEKAKFRVFLCQELIQMLIDLDFTPYQVSIFAFQSKMFVLSKGLMPLYILSVIFSHISCFVLPNAETDFVLDSLISELLFYG